jgi:hypothetical protein
MHNEHFLRIQCSSTKLNLIIDPQEMDEKGEAKFQELVNNALSDYHKFVPVSRNAMHARKM